MNIRAKFNRFRNRIRYLFDEDAIYDLLPKTASPSGKPQPKLDRDEPVDMDEMMKSFIEGQKAHSKVRP